VKSTDLPKVLADGFLGFVAEYRNSKAEAINYTDKMSGRAATLKTLRHGLEVNGEAVAFNERVPDSFKIEDYKAPFAKGQKVLVTLTSLQNDKGVIRASGKLDVIT
jgi:hypothetical protein